MRFYRFAGFKVVREVSQDSLSSFGDLVVWGGEGTRMDVNIESFLELWTPRIRKAVETKK